MSKRRLIGVAFTAGLFAGAVLWFTPPYTSISSDCEFLVEAKLSPQGSWVAERFEMGCAGYVELLLRRAETQSAKAPDVFLPARHDQDNSFDLLFKWLNESALLIAIPQRNERLSQWPAEFRSLEKPDKFNGVQLSYAAYPNDPDLARDAGSRSIVRKRVAFDYRFIAHKGERPPSVGC